MGKVPEEKKKLVKKVAESMKKAKTVMLVSIKSLPSNQLQKMKKDLRGKANITVLKKNILNRAVDECSIEEMKTLKNNIAEDMALLLSETEGFEISAFLNDNKNPIGAKEGQIAEDDISIEAGPTELVPGPVISELGSLGLQISVEEGKISIKKSKVVVKKGEKVLGNAVSILQKLNIKPFMIGLNPIAFYDSDSKRVYVGIKIDKKKSLAQLLEAFVKSKNMATGIGYLCRETISGLIGKAGRQANSLIKLQNSIK
jgi:large subunit ribosomal protein L10